MSMFAMAMVWGVVVLTSFFGWGAVVRWMAGVRNGADRLDAVTWGMAMSVVVGGVLNLCGAATQNFLAGFVIAGAGLGVVEILRVVKKHAWISAEAWALGAVVVVLLAMRLAGSVIVTPAGDSPPPGSTFNPHDDLQSYLVSVERMVQTSGGGTLGVDPFNSRLMMSGLGGQHFLGALVVAVLPQDNVHLMDAGVGVVALALSAGALALRLGLSRRGVVGLMIVALALPMQSLNISSSFTSAAMMLALASSVMERRNLQSLRGMLMPAILLASVCSLKSTMIPGACVFVAMVILLEWAFRRPGPTSPRAGAKLLIVPLMAFVFLLPWMIWQYRNSGTMLYPLLGLGDHVMRFFPQAFPPQTAPGGLMTKIFELTILPAVGLIAAGILAAIRKTRVVLPGRGVLVVMAFLVAWIFACAAIGWATEFPDLERYIFPMYAGGVILLVGFVYFMIERFVPKAGAFAVIFFLVATFSQWLPLWKSVVPRDIAAAAAGSLRPMAEMRGRFEDLQNAVPKGEVLLAYLTNPTVLDFARNRVYVLDWPGETSPPPGMPVMNGGEAVRNYLLGQGIRYVAYSYAEQANFPRQIYGVDLNAEMGKTIRRQATEAFAFQDDLRELRKSCATIYDNGGDFVLDLSKPAVNAQ